MPEEVVQDILIKGADEAIRQLIDVGQAGEAAFNRLRDAAQRFGVAEDAVDGVARAAQRLQVDVQKINEEMDKAAATEYAKQIKIAEQALKSAEQTGREFGSALRDAGGAVAGFLGRIGKIAGVAAAASAGVLLLVRNAFKMSKQQEADRIADQRGLRLEERSHIQTAAATLQHADAQDELLTKMRQGVITGEEWRKQSDALDETFKRQQITEQRLSAIREDEARATAKATAALRERQRIQNLELQFGPALTASLLGLGRSLEAVRQGFLSTFGPVIAGFVDRIKSLIDSNRDRITAFFVTISNSIQAAFGDISLEEIFQGLISFGEQAVQIITGLVVPAIKGLLAILDLIAKSINGIFGTNFTGPGLIAVALIAQLTGGFKLFSAALAVAVTGFNALKLVVGGPWAIILILALTAIVALLTQIDWAAVSVKVQEAWKVIVDTVTKARDDVSARWEELKKFFVDLWVAIVGFFTDGALKIVELTDRVKNTILELWASIKSKAMQFLQPVFDFLDSLLSLAARVLAAVRQASSEAKSVAAGTAPGMASGGPVRGPGTSLSDSILAWLSNGEFVVSAKGTSFAERMFPGLLSAINRGKMPGFNMGGLVDGLSSVFNPRVPLMLAEGGPVPRVAGRPMTLVIEGEQFRGLTATDEAAEQLERFALKRRTRRAGRSPNWIT